MSEEPGTPKTSSQEMKPDKKEPDNRLTGEEIAQIADLFAGEPAPEEEEDTGEFNPVQDDTGSFKRVE